MYCVCKKPHPLFEIGKPTFCANCAEEIVICPAPVASPEEKSYSAIGPMHLSGPSNTVDPIRAQAISEAVLNQIYQQKAEISELTKGIQFLAEQVKTLVDSLAEEQEDPDRPVTAYMSGKPV